MKNVTMDLIYVLKQPKYSTPDECVKQYYANWSGCSLDCYDSETLTMIAKISILDYLTTCDSWYFEINRFFDCIGFDYEMFNPSAKKNNFDYRIRNSIWSFFSINTSKRKRTLY